MRSCWHLMLLNVCKNLLTASPWLHFNTVTLYYFTEIHLLCHLGIYESELTDVQCNEEYYHLFKHVWHFYTVISVLRSLTLDNPKSCLPIHLTYLVSSLRTCWKVTTISCLLVSYQTLTRSICLISIRFCNTVHITFMNVIVPWLLLLYVFSIIHHRLLLKESL